MEITVIIRKFFINGKEVKRPEITIPELETKIRENEKKLENLKSEKTSFLKLEVTDK